MILYSVNTVFFLKPDSSYQVILLTLLTPLSLCSFKPLFLSQCLVGLW